MRKPTIEEVVGAIFITILVLCLLAVIALIIFIIYLLVEYGGKPVDEIPFWVLWFLH